MSAYSFKDCVAALSGPGGSINLGAGAGAAEEGITIASVNPKNAMTVGADGQGVHSLRADDSVTVTVRVLKTSPVNALLGAMLSLQQLSSVAWGRNTLNVRDIARGDDITVEQVAFQRWPDLNFATEAGMNEWVFDGIRANRILGVGTPEI